MGKENSVFNHSSSGLANSLLDAVEILTNKKIDEAKFDRTIQATVLSCTSNTKGEYKCQYQDSKFIAYAPNPDVTYSENTLVYVLIPGNDWDAIKTILGTVDKLGVDYIANISNKEYFDPIGSNVIDGNALIELNTWDGQHYETIYEKDGINLISLNTDRVSDYFQSSEAAYFYIQADFKTKIETGQKLGHYGLKITTSRATKDGYKEYYFLSDEMEGEPRNFVNFSTQSNFKRPFLIETRIDNNQEVNDFGEIIKIEAFVENYTEEEGHLPDIQIQNFELVALHKLSEMDMTDGYLSIITPAGSVFYRGQDNTIVPNLVKMIARVRMNGVISDDTDIKYYWFRRDARVFGGSDFEYLYCPITGVNTNGWACLNTSHTEGGKVIWDPASKEKALAPSDVVSTQMYYKCVAIYDNLVMEREITIQNKAANYNIFISSTNGFKFYQDQGETQLTCNIEWGNIQPPADLHYYWAVTNSEGVFNSRNWDRPSSDIIEAVTIIGFAKYFCTIYSNNEYIGTGLAVLTNSDIINAGSYYLNITNGTQLFKYDEEGLSPVEKGQPILPLEVEMYDSQGIQLTEAEIRQLGSIKWYVPRDNSMIVAPMIPGLPVTEYTDPQTGIVYYVYQNIANLPFEIADDYDYMAINNQIKLAVEYDNNVYIDKTSFAFLKEGDLGTNGTKYSIRIVPNATAEFPSTKRVWITEKSDGTWSFNFNQVPNQFPFKVNIYRNSDILYSGYSDGVSYDITYKIRWEVADGDNKSFYHINNTEFVYDGLQFDQESYSGRYNLKQPSNNLLKVTVNIGTDDGKTLYSFLPIGVVKIFNSYLDTKKVGLYEKNDITSGFAQVIYNTDGENPVYSELYPFEPKVINTEGTEDETSHYAIDTQLLGSNLQYEEENPTHIIPTDYYEGVDVCNAVYYKCLDQFVIYAPVVFALNRYGLGSLNAWDGTHIKIDEEGGYIYAPQMGAGKKEDDNSFTGVLLGKVDIPNSNEKVGLMAYGHGRRTVWIDANTGKAEFGAGRGRIILDPDSEDALIYGGAQESDPTAGMVINLNEPSIRWNNGNFIVDEDGYIKALNMELQRPNHTIYYQINPYGLLIDVGNTGDYPAGEEPNCLEPPSAAHKKFVIMDSDVNPERSALLPGYQSNAVAEFGSDGITLQCLGTRSYLTLKDGDDITDNGPNVTLKSANALYLQSGLLRPLPDPETPDEEQKDEDDRVNASVNIKAAYNSNIWSGHGLTLRVTGPHDKDIDPDTGEPIHPTYPDPYLNNTYGYMKLVTQYGWIYLSHKAGGKKNTPGIGLNAYTWQYRQENRGESEDDPMGVGGLDKGTPFPGQDYKVYINGHEVLTNGNVADSTGGDIGGVCYVSEFGNIRPYLNNLVSLGSYYEEGDGIAAWRHVVTYDTIQVSDRREKEKIQDMDQKYIDLIMKLKPKKYKYISDPEHIYRTGFIAQEVEESIAEVGLRNKDFGGLKKKAIVKNDVIVDYGYGLNYDDFVAALVLTVQDLQKQINDLKGELKHGT